jgi:hypothetical protein
MPRRTITPPQRYRGKPSGYSSFGAYLWTEAGTNLGLFNDNDPYGPDGTNQNTSLHLSNFLTLAESVEVVSGRHRSDSE